MRLFICPILALTFLTTHSNLLAQTVNEEQAINKLVQTSNQLLDDDELIASKLLPMTWADLPLDIKASPKIQFCYALVRLQNNLPSSATLNRAVLKDRTNMRMKKIAIYTAFKESGAVSGCRLLCRYSQECLKEKRDKDFLLWSMGVCQSLLREDAIEPHLKVFSNTSQYKEFVTLHENEIDKFMTATKAEHDRINLEIAKKLDADILECKDKLEQLFKALELETNQIEAEVGLIWNNIGTSWLFNNFKCIPVDYNGNTISYSSLLYRNLKLDPIWGVRSIGPYRTVREISTGQLFGLGRTFIPSVVKGGEPTYLPNHYELQSWLANISRRQAFLGRLIQFNQLAIQRTNVFAVRLSELHKRFGKAIISDAELNFQFEKLASQLLILKKNYSTNSKTEIRRQALEQRTLKELGAKLLPALQINLENEIANLQIAKP